MSNDDDEWGFDGPTDRLTGRLTSERAGRADGSYFIACFVYKVRHKYQLKKRKVSTNLNVDATYTVFDAEKERKKEKEDKGKPTALVKMKIACVGDSGGCDECKD